jgi:Tol biopolymer transport system component
MGLDSTWTASLVSIASGQARPVPGAYVAQAFSRDGRRLLIAKLVEDESGLVGVSWKVVPVDGGAPLDSLRLPPQSTGAVWSPDERGMTFLNTADPGQNVYRVDFHGGHPVPVTSFTAGRIQGYQWSTDGKKLAVIRRLGDATNVWVMEADGTHPTQVTQFTSGDVFELHWLPDNRRLAVNAGTSSQDAVLVRDFQ